MVTIKDILKIVICIYAMFCITFICNADTSMYVNSTHGLRLREKCNTESEILEVIPDNEKVDVIAKVLVKFDCWYKVKRGDTIGYVNGKYLSLEENAPDVVEKETDTKLNEYEYLGMWLITAYTHTGNPCANGNYPSAGYTVACNSLDFGTKIYIDGVGERVVEDRGPSSLGSEWIDLFCDSYDECINWGNQMRAVYLVK